MGLRKIKNPGGQQSSGVYDVVLTIILPTPCQVNTIRIRTVTFLQINPAKNEIIVVIAHELC